MVVCWESRGGMVVWLGDGDQCATDQLQMLQAPWP